MGEEELWFSIVENYDCPLYQQEEWFSLSGHVLLLPDKKPACLELVRDITEFINLSTSITISENDCNSGEVAFNCSGCTGLIRLIYQKGKPEKITADTTRPAATAADHIAKLLSNFSMFKTLSELEIKELVSLLKVKSFAKGDIIVKQGTPGKNLFIITSGKVEVVDDDGISITFLNQGDVFGEMSLLSGDPAGASIKVVDSAKVMCINSNHFRKVIHKYPSLQMYLARLLTQRLAKANMARTIEMSSDMSGTLAETSPSELFQTCSINEKSGTLTLKLENSTAELFFNKGKLIRVKHGEQEGKEAFYELLKEKKGRYKFVSGLSQEDMNLKEIGHFMCLLMDGLSKMDDEEFEKK